MRKDSKANRDMRASTTITTSLVGLLTFGVGYALYFDFKRRHDPDFRKRLRQNRRDFEQRARVSEKRQRDAQRNRVSEAVQRARDEPVPAGVEQREEYFMNEVAAGETMAASGDDTLGAAICFYKALKVYPNPQDLLTIYDRTVPRPVYELLMLILQTDAQQRPGESTVNLD